MSLEQRDKAKVERLVVSIRKEAEMAPANVRALWDWFYVCQLRYDNAAVFDAAGRLSRAAANDPVALWAYLHVMGGRQLPLGSELFFSQLTSSSILEDHVASLDSGELDHVMACYQALKTRRPDLAAALVLIIFPTSSSGPSDWIRNRGFIARRSPTHLDWARSPALWYWPHGGATRPG